jgi:ABC-type antimicrobial peptide transport system permease subunit
MTDVANTFLIDSDFIHADNTALLNRANEDFESFDDLFDDLFFDASFVDAIYNDDALFIENTEEIKAENTAWNFIIGKVKDGQSISQTIRQLNSSFKKASIPVEAVNWRSAAGATASYLYFLRLILNIGVIIILLSGFIIINNTLSIHVIDRTQEIGSMRAIGAKKSFIALLFLSETFLLTLISSFFAILLGLFLQTMINSLAFSIGNEFIIQLIGSSTLYITSSFKSVFILVIASLGLTFISWLSPVKTALEVSPLAAMRENQ